MVLNSSGYAIAKPIAHTLIGSASSLADLINRVNNALIAGGWTFDSLITGGQRLLGVSPQGYQVFLDLTNASPFGFPQLCIKLRSTTTSAVGPIHVLDYNGSYSWRVISYPCGFFISRPGVHGDPRGSSICGGIPRLASNCTLDQAQVPGETWFSFGDGHDLAFFITHNPRANIDHGSDALGNQCGCFNGVATISTSGNSWDSVQILRISSASLDTGSPGFHPILSDGTDLVYPAFVAWPSAPGNPIKIRGQLYNAAIWSGMKAGDQTYPRDGMSWITYTDNYYWGTLVLLKSNPSAASLANLAY